jgi:hypothetical protein
VTVTADVPPTEAPARPPSRLVRSAVLALLVVFAAFWTWALFFASKDAVNKIGDRGWAERAEAICAEANAARAELADFTRIDQPTPELISRRAGIVDASTDVIERMLDDVVAVAPTDAKGAAIVPKWEAEYRTYIGDRRRYADELRASGENLAFYETAADGLPVTERLETFAGDNDMPACAPPRDLTR